MASELRFDQRNDLLVRNVFDVGNVILCALFLFQRLLGRHALFTQQRPRVDACLQHRLHPLQGRVELDLANGHEGAKGVAQVLLECNARDRLLKPLYRTRVLYVALCMAAVADGYLSDRHTICDFSRHYNTVTDTNGYYKLITMYPKYHT